MASIVCLDSGACLPSLRLRNVDLHNCNSVSFPTDENFLLVLLLSSLSPFFFDDVRQAA